MASHRLVLHLGAHRTGTTSLQAALEQARPALSDAGVDAIVPPGPGRRQGKWLRRYYRCQRRRHAWAAALPFGSALVSPLILRHLRNRIATAIDATCRTLILSDEEFLGPIVDVARPAGPYPRLTASLLLLSDFARGHDTAIFLGVRSYEDFFLSAFLMDCVYGRRTQDIAPYRRAAMDLRGGWVRVVETIGGLFPGARLTVWPQETFNLRARFEALTGVKAAEMPGLDFAARANASPTEEAIDAVRALAAYRRPSKEECDALVERHACGGRMRVGDVFTPAEIQALRDAYAGHLEQLRAMPGVTVA